MPGPTTRRKAVLSTGIVLTLIALASTVAAQTSTVPFLDYRTDSWFMPQGPSVTAGPVAGLFNPGAVAMTDGGMADFWWNDRSVRKGLDNYGFGFGRNLNFAMNTSTYGDTDESFKIYDYQIGLAGGVSAGSFGLGYRWSRGETQRVDRQNALVVGMTSRKRAWSSFGASAIWSLQSNAAQYVFDLGVRPFQKNWLTVFADYAVNQNQSFFKDGGWSAGVEVRPIPGIHLGFRARDQLDGDDLDYTLQFGITINDLHGSVLPRYDEDFNSTMTGFLIRSEPPFSGLPAGTIDLTRGDNVLPISLENRVLTYQKYRYFDTKRVAWLDLLDLLNRIEDDDRVDIVAINLARFAGRPSLLWEFRRKLEDLQAAGKKVAIHIDRAGSRVYHLASVANYLTIDPQGAVMLPGNLLTRSYLKGTLEKLGIGFQEHRYFKYKSAAESFSRDSMSDADREQRQRIIDVIYEETRDAVTASRNLSDDQYDGIVNDLTILIAREAVEVGLVDGTGRWDGLMKGFQAENKVRRVTPHQLDYDREYPDDQWGQPCKIPVVYAVGPCAMDEGIKGRRTSQYMKQLARDPNVKAVVLRADSPGGDPLPSDLVAEATRILVEAGKPVIVSQGDVAASGGYWISMDGTEIMTTPMTITGSIGVISGWMWDDGASSKIGVTADAVTRGKHADLFSMVNFPFLGGIPRRPMNDEELDRTKRAILELYGDFVQAVADGRKMSPDAVGEIAQGRVWMGPDAVANGLADRIGTLDEAIERARELSGIPDWQEIEIVEFPPRKLFPWPNLGPSMPGLFGISRIGDWFDGWSAQLAEDQMAALESGLPDPGVPGLGTLDVEYLKTLSAAPGSAQLMVSPDLLPEDWRELD